MISKKTGDLENICVYADELAQMIKHCHMK